MDNTAWVSEKFYKNSFVFYIENVWLYSLNVFLKNEVFLCNSTLIENSAVDNKNSNKFINDVVGYANLTVFSNYYLYTLKTRIMFLFGYSGSNIPSVDKIYKSASWLERETGEMFGIQYTAKVDTRRLLLDYSKQENPLLKDYPCEGFNDVFYNFFEDQVVFNQTTAVEL